MSAGGWAGATPSVLADISPKYDDSAVEFGGERDMESFYEHQNLYFRRNRPSPNFEPPHFAGRNWGRLGGGGTARLADVRW